jgi:NADH-quinone oxidoreductase subunit M
MSHILSIILFTPLVGAIALLFVSSENVNAIRRTANIFALGEFLISLVLVPMFWAQRFEPGFKFIEGTSSNWIPSLGAGYNLGIDGISFLLIALTSLLGWISILSSWTTVQSRAKEYYVWLLVLQTGIIGIFMALDLFLFFVFWEATLVPIYLLIGIWGGPRRLYAGTKFFLYTQLGSVAMLLGILSIYFHHYSVTNPHVFTFAIPELYKTAPLIPFNVSAWLFVAFFGAFAIRLPMFPFHTWLPDALMESPAPVAVMLVGSFLLTGIYAIVRLLLPFFPMVVPYPRARGWMIALSLIGITYGALLSLVQKDTRKLLAYFCLSQMGFCTLGILTLNPDAVTGTVARALGLGMSTGAMFLIAGFLRDLPQAGKIVEHGGLCKRMPVLAVIAAAIFLSSIGLLLLDGIVIFKVVPPLLASNWKWALWVGLGIVLTAASLLGLYRRVFLGSTRNSKNERLRDLTTREIVVFAPLIVGALWITFYPKPLVQILEQPVSQIIQAIPKASR